MLKSCPLQYIYEPVFYEIEKEVERDVDKQGFYEVEVECCSLLNTSREGIISVKLIQTRLVAEQVIHCNGATSLLQ